ncbi:MAG: PqqD family protein [Treponema sp.]|nr:PqqD family protein [Treponema sp.]
MQNYKPIFDKEAFDFLREEKEKNYTILLKAHPELTELFVNQTTMDILNLCNGSNTLSDILKIQKSKYSSVDENTITNDVASILTKFTNFSVINWDEDFNPYLITHQKYFENGYNIKIAEEREGLEILEKVNNLDESSSYLSAHFLKSQYTDLSIRYKIFYKSEEFFLLYDKTKEVQCIIGVQMPVLPFDTVAKVTFVSNINDSEKSVFLLNYIFDTIPNIAVKPITKIATVIDCQKTKNDVYNVFYSSNFTLEAKLKNEIGMNTEVAVLSIFF